MSSFWRVFKYFDTDSQMHVENYDPRSVKLWLKHRSELVNFVDANMRDSQLAYHYKLSHSRISSFDDYIDNFESEVAVVDRVALRVRSLYRPNVVRCITNLVLCDFMLTVYLFKEIGNGTEDLDKSDLVHIRNYFKPHYSLDDDSFLYHFDSKLLNNSFMLFRFLIENFSRVTP